MLKWEALLSGVRRKTIAGQRSKVDPAELTVGRQPVERDYDRILFAAPTRRLADKTQVFPMEVNDSVRTRLTHSHEVSGIARSIGIRLAFEHAEEVFGSNHEELQVKRVVPALLAAIGLAHDLGNPPFGHQGEASMQQWFIQQAVREAKRQGIEVTSDTDLTAFVEPDFLSFDGNAQTLRLLTRLQVVNDDYGLNLTVATLAALIKYPTIYGENKQGSKKSGVFRSESAIIEEVWQATGLQAGIRHPLTVVMEACDDIAYSVIDSEDTVKKGYASFYDLLDFIETGPSDPVIEKLLSEVRGRHNELRREGLSSRELNDISMQVFRARAISKMVNSATRVFVDRIGSLMDGSASPTFELIAESDCRELCRRVKKFGIRYGFKHPDVLRLELKGHNYIHSMMDMLWRAVQMGASSNNPFDRYVYGTISENYRRVYEKAGKDEYAKRQLVCDAISGMTETYLVKKHEMLCGLSSATK